MKIVITESKLKSFLKDRFDFDLSDKIRMVQNWGDLSSTFKRMIRRKFLNHFLNEFGPMYLFTTDNGEFLYQKQGGDILIVDDRDRPISLNKFYENIGFTDTLGISLDDLIDTYFNEDEYL